MKSLEQYLELPYTVVIREFEKGRFAAEVPQLPGCCATGETAQDALARLQRAKRVWIHECVRRGEAVPEPQNAEPLPSGRWLQRVPRTLHKKLSVLARKEGVSLNQLVTSILAEAAGVRSQARPNTVGTQTARQVWGLMSNWISAYERSHSRVRALESWYSSPSPGEPNVPFAALLEHILSLGPHNNEELRIVRENDADRVEDARHRVRAYLRGLPS